MIFLHELVNSFYPNPIIRELKYKEILEDPNVSGSFWEQVLEHHMPHTNRCKKRNQVGKDFEDYSDAKFTMAGRYTDSNSRVATIGGITHKIGTLRVCLCMKGGEFHKVYFMKIPHEAYANLAGENIKISFKDYTPTGKMWDKYQCSWEEVIQPI